MRRRQSGLTGLAALGMLLGASGMTQALAQSQSDAGLFSPTVNDPKNPQRFQTLMKNEPPGFRPQRYGNPPASGAGTTGFDSTNARKKKKEPAFAAPPPRAPVAPATDDALAPIYRPVVPSTMQLNRMSGASADADATGTASAPVKRPARRATDDDPYAALGIRAGSFIYKPAVEITGGYDTNPGRMSGGTGSTTTVLAPELSIKSDWSRHEFSADLRGSYSWYQDLPQLSRPMFEIKTKGKIDFTSQTHADLEGGFLRTTDTPGNPNNPTDIASPPTYNKFNAAAGLTHRFNRLEVTAKATAERTEYENTTLNDGTPFDLQDRNYNQYGGTLRGTYELTPGIKPFVEVGYDQRIHDLSVDFSGVQRDSNGQTVRAGSTFELTRKLTGEASIGYLTRDYKDPTLSRVQGLIGDASLVYAATPLTTATFTAKSTVDESTMTGVSGIFRHDFGLQIDHSFRRWLVATLKGGYGIDDYQGIGRRDERYTASAGLVYKVTPTVQIKGEVRQEWLHSNVPGQDYTATVGLVGLRLQR